MKGDFSRVTFDPSRHYSGVRMQQGRVQLDADWNEQVDITEHRIGTEITDVIGQSGAPDGNAGFELSVAATGASRSDVIVGRGRYYVEGMLFEAERDVPFAQQADLPGAGLPTTDGTYVAYLDVWQRHVTSLQDPLLVEPALGGADTATRIRNVAQVKLHLLTDQDSKDPKDYFPPWQPAWDRPLSAGTVAARVSAPRATLENQLYRVEIHHGGPVGTATFKWSRDNGSIAAGVKAIEGVTITLRPGVREAPALFAPNQFLEVVDEGRVLRGEPGVLAEIASVQGDEVTVVGWPGNVAPSLGAQPIARRWDSVPGDAPIRAGQLPLEQDIEVSFDTSGAARYTSGDYWLIPARHLTGEVEWPRNDDGTPRARGPHGTRHRYCALALLRVSQGQWSVLADVRVRFQPIATGLLTKAGGTVTGPLSVLGDVGIGTTTPSAGLEINKGTTNDAALVVSSSGPGFGSGVQFLNTSATGGRRYAIYSNVTGSWIFSDETAGQTRLVVNRSGDLCVGLAESDQSRLHVRGAARPPSSAGTGTVSVRASTTTVTGDRTQFTKELRARDLLEVKTSRGTVETREVAVVQSDTTLVLTSGFKDEAASVAFFIVKPAHLARFSDGAGVTQCLLSHDGNLEVRGQVFTGEARTPTPFTHEGVRIVRGTVRKNTQIAAGVGFAVARGEVTGVPQAGLFDIKFPDFAGLPSASVTIVQNEALVFDTSTGEQPNPDFGNKGRNTKENAVIVAIEPGRIRVRTGNADGNPEDKNFTFVAIGPR